MIIHTATGSALGSNISILVTANPNPIMGFFILGIFTGSLITLGSIILYLWLTREKDNVYKAPVTTATTRMGKWWR